MQSLITLILVLTPMFIGFAIPVNIKMTALAEKGLSYLVFIILGLIGIELAQVEGLGSQIGEIALYVTILSILTIGSGLFALMLFDHLKPW
ncbi:MAG TPA: hypothetical protein DCR60_11560, partial [Psychrobacter sp.]|nr:hypothetical protein [Psychrobacter sp.]